MIHFVIGLIAFVAIFGGALIGIFAARALPEHHLSNESRNAVSVSAAIVGTLSALVIGLMISTANSSFSTRSSEVTSDRRRPRPHQPHDAALWTRSG